MKKGMEGSINMEQKGCESIGCWIYHVTLSYELDLGFQGQILKNRIPGMGRPIDMERKGCESIGIRTHFVTLNFDLIHKLDLGF